MQSREETLNTEGPQEGIREEKKRIKKEAPMVQTGHQRTVSQRKWYYEKIVIIRAMF